MRSFFNPLRELVPPNPFLLLIALCVFLIFGAICAFAQVATPAVVLPAAPSGFWNQAISYGLDVGGTLLAAAGTWIIGQIIRILNITDQAKRLQVEDTLRNAFHFLVENGVRFAYAKANAPLTALPTPQMIADAMFYVKGNGPDKLVQLSVDDAALERAIISKAHLLTSYFVPQLSAGVSDATIQTLNVSSSNISTDTPAPAAPVSTVVPSAAPAPAV